MKYSMRAVAYSIVDYEKELLVKANAKVHNLTMISNKLDFDTIHYTEGKEVVIVSERDHLHSDLIYALHKIGVKNIISRSTSLEHINIICAYSLGLHVSNSSPENLSFENVLLQTIVNLNNWADSYCLR